MRRAILGVLFLVAACGGDVRNDGGAVKRDSSPVDARAERARYLMTSEAQEVIASFAKSHSQDALDACLNAWVEENAAELLGAPVEKPQKVFLRWFLSQCLGESGPGDLRGTDGASARTSYIGGVRTSYPNL